MRDIVETDEEKAMRYRYQAEEVRALAVLAPPDDVKIRAALFVIADHYDNMAAALDPQRKFG